MRSRWAVPLVVLSGLLLAPGRSHAQAVPESMLAQASGDDHVRGRVSMDPAFMFGVGYVRGLELDARGQRHLGVHVDLEVLIDFSSWDLTSGVSARLWDRPGFDVLAAIDLDLKLAQNEVHTALAYGYRIALLPGYYAPKWYVAAELGLRGNIATTIWQGDDYLAQVPTSASGTYLTGTTFLSFGASAGLRFLRHYFAGVRAAYRAPTTFESYGPWVQPLTVGIEFGGTLSVF